MKPRRPGAAPAGRGTGGTRRPFHGAAYTGTPFGPFPAAGSGKPLPSDVDRQTSGTVDMRGVSDWRSVLTVETAPFSWGELLITCEAIASPTVAGATNVENWPWVEIRILCQINGQDFILAEGAVGNHNNAAIGDETKSAGPFFCNFVPGEVPDRLVVQARARRGGTAETSYDTDEKLDLVAVTRFRQ